VSVPNRVCRPVASALLAGSLAGAALLGMVSDPALAQAQAGEWRAVVVGIDDYRDPEGILSDLSGAVNDARDIAETLRTLGITDLSVLLDDQATRGAVVGAWDRALARAHPGDLLLLTYAGHGMQRVAAVDSEEADGYDEFLALHAFERRGPGRQDFILDDEIGAFVDKAGDKGVTVALVVDACHSGTTFRAVDRRVRPRYRFSNVKVEGDLMADLDESMLFEGLDVDSGGAEETIADNLFSFSAVLDDSLAPEIALPDESGQAVPRGALSYYFARGLRGAADADRDGVLRFDEFKDYIIRNIRTATQGQQIPSIVASDENWHADLSPAAGAHSSPAPMPDRPIRLAVHGEVAARLPPLEGVQVVAVTETPDIVWDPATGDVISGIDTVVAEDIDADALQGVVSKARAHLRFAALAEMAPLTIAASPPKPTYADGELVTLIMDDLTYPYLTLVNLANDGTVQFLYPLDAVEAGPRDPAEPFILEDILVGRPYGADLLVGLATDRPLPDMVEALRGLDGTTRALDVPDRMEERLRSASYRLGLFALYTCAQGAPQC